MAAGWAQGQIHTQGIISGNELSQSQYGIGLTGTAVGHGFSAAGLKSSASTWAYADYGVLKVSAAGSSSHPSHITAYSSASFSDQVTFDAPGLYGTYGKATFSFQFDHDLSASNSGEVQPYPATSQFSLDGGMSGPWTPRSQVVLRSTVNGLNGNTTVNDSLIVVDVNYPGGSHVAISGNKVSITSEFMWGIPSWLGLTIYVNGSVPNNPYGFSNAGSFVADASHSAYWGGIQAVTLADGSAVHDFSVVSTSGTDYRVSFAPLPSVPEPGSLTSMLAGLAVFAVVFGRKRLHSQA